MRQVFVRYEPEETVPAVSHLGKNRKLKKYFNRETAAAVTAMGKFLDAQPMDTAEIPIFYATGMLAFEDYGLSSIATGSTVNGTFDLKAFVTDGLEQVSPLSQFKILQNMPLCFVSIIFGFRGENAVLYSSAEALLAHGESALCEPVFLGAGKTYEDGTVEAGFALLSFAEMEQLHRLCVPVNDDGEAIGLFRPAPLGGTHD